MTTSQGPLTTPEPEIPVRLVQLWLCDPCLDGVGDECHTPGCSLWIHDVPKPALRGSQGVTILGPALEPFMTPEQVAAQDARPALGWSRMPYGEIFQQARGGDSWANLGPAGQTRVQAGAEAVAMDVMRRWKPEAAPAEPKPAPEMAEPRTVPLDAAMLHREVHKQAEALEAIIREVDALDEPGPAADVIRMLALHGLGEGPHPDGDDAKPAPDTRTVDADQFAALCNLFCFTTCGAKASHLTPEQFGDILLHRAFPVVCDHSRLMARAVLAYLGFRTGIPVADELISEIHAAMRNGKGSLPDGDNTPAGSGESA